MKAFLGWLLNRALLYILLVVAIAFALLAWPTLSDTLRGLGSETLSRGELIEQVETAREDGQRSLASAVEDARTLPAEQLRSRIAARRADRERAQRLIDADEQQFLAGYLPSRILERKRAEIEIAVIDREIAVLEAALEPRATIERQRAFIAENPTVPTMAAIAASRRACITAGEAVDDFEDLSGIERAIRNLLRDESDGLEQAERARCADLQRLTQRRKAGIAAARALVAANERLDALAADPLPRSYSRDITGVTLRDILVQALLAFLAITLIPFAIRALFYYVLAPIAARRPPLRFAASEDAVAFAPGERSGISLALPLGAGETALVRQDFLQSTSMKGEKRTQWLLDWRHPVASFASGMRFLTRIDGAGEEVIVSAVKDPFAEVAMLTIPAGGAAVVRPRALAAIVHSEDEAPRVTSHWRLFSLPAWLTMQLRYFVFHGPAKLVLKGGRGVRIEAAHNGRILGQDQVIGFSTDLAYSVIRTETFAPYFFGRESLLKDRVEGSRGVLLVEEAPLAGKTGIRRGLEGTLDAMLKAFGI